MDAILGIIRTDYLVCLMDSTFAYIRDSAVRAPYFAEMNVLSA